MATSLSTRTPSTTGSAWSWILAAVQAAVDTERAGGQWPVFRAHPGAEHDQRTAEFAHHRCDCQHCLHGGGPGDDEGPIWT
ncbi:hypothetical protein [Kitasatospora purpeofusca]|uniref:hypothetical protein n=1 Tax=Kitasatospora purpeofusca TaxID=67352 RepID=UPI0036D2D267